ncbi:ATP-binding cassette sub-family F member 3 [Exaiptasia diaphana]|nr:ATP-binding cassette sub-family F member 3 [Exaiptasia diaphana]
MVTEPKYLKSTICLTAYYGEFKVVDQKKLQKAEAKLKAKQEKREEKEDRKTPTNIEMDGATASQSANRREAKLEASGTNKSRDIKIENFDLAYGESEMDGATASQSANRREAKLEASGTNKSRDIKIENFDLAYGERFVRYASV